MKVAFWSNYSGSGVTTNVVAVGAALTQMYRMRIALISNHFEMQNLGYSVLGREYDSLIRESSKYYACGETRFHMRRIMSPGCDSLINGPSYDGYEDGLYYYLQERLYSDSLYDMNYDSSFSDTVEMLEEKTDFVFMDLQSKSSLSTVQQLETADLVVVTLKQNEEVIKNFFKKYGSMAGKCIFFLNRYDPQGKYLKGDLVRDYHIHPDRIATLLNNHEFSSCIADGRIIPYIIKNINCEKPHKQYREIQHLKNASKQLYNALTEKIYGGEAANTYWPALAN